MLGCGRLRHQTTSYLFGVVPRLYVSNARLEILHGSFLADAPSYRAARKKAQKYSTRIFFEMVASEIMLASI